MERKKENKIFSIIKLIFKIIIILFVVSFILMVVLQRVSKNEFSFLNIRLFSVLTGSMEPKYEVGDVLISIEKEPEDIKKGDAISYLGKEGTFDGKVVTHEVIDIETGEDGKLLFTTKGIANTAIDPIVSEDQVYGVVLFEAVPLSFIYGIISKPLGMYLLIIVPILFIIGYEIVSRMLEKEEKRRSNYRD